MSTKAVNWELDLKQAQRGGGERRRLLAGCGPGRRRATCDEAHRSPSWTLGVPMAHPRPPACAVKEGWPSPPMLLPTFTQLARLPPTQCLLGTDHILGTMPGNCRYEDEKT